MRKHKALARGFIAAIVVMLAMGSAGAAQDPTMGTVSIEATSVAAGLGYKWGRGVLEYRGKSYPFTLKGVSVIDVGVSKATAKGEVYNLKSVEDFEGLFIAAEAAGTLGGGASAAAMRNQNAVSMVWTATSEGLGLSLAQAGLTVAFTEEAKQEAARARQQRSSAAPRIQ